MSNKSDCTVKVKVDYWGFIKIILPSSAPSFIPNPNLGAEVVLLSHFPDDDGAAAAAAADDDHPE